LGLGSGCRGSRLAPAAACGWPAFAQYRPAPEGGHKAWALIVLELSGDRISAINSFLDVDRLFPRFGLPLTLAA
jgi:RNA polymerase sigma-70 factor (ECF subfamily)